MSNTHVVKSPRMTPAKVTRRPPQPFRPEPSQVRDLSLLAARLYRRRHRTVSPGR